MDKKVFIFICASLVIFSLALWGWGCSKKPESQEVSEYPLNTSTASQPTDVIVINPAPTQNAAAPAQAPQPPTELSAAQTSTPPTVSEGEKRLARNKDIQAALKNAGFYSGEVDGKIGPMTRKAIREFQTSKGLAADGKVGPKTWVELEKYLNPPTDSKKSKKRK